MGLRVLKRQMECRYCKARCVKAGVRRGCVQKFRCKACKKYQQQFYCKRAYELDINSRIAQLLIEGISMRGIARVLKISTATVMQRIKCIAKAIVRPRSHIKHGIYEVDEMWTYIGNKTNTIWVMYVFDRKAKTVVDFKIGSRTKANLQALIDSIVPRIPQKICTDGLNIYQSLIPSAIHRIGLTYTRHIERHNLNLRTHLKRLSRKTICFSKSKEMLEACLKIYFWGSQNFNSCGAFC